MIDADGNEIVSPFQGLSRMVDSVTQGVALGWFVSAFQAAAEAVELAATIKKNFEELGV